MVDNRHKACDTCGYFYRNCACGGDTGRAYAKGYREGRDDGFERGKRAGARDAERDRPHLYKTGEKSWRVR